MKAEHATKKPARVSDAAVKAKTAKTWSEWFTILDKAGARKMNHTEIAAYLYKEKKCPGWWNQMVAVGYEQERGMREKHQKPSGYEISRSKTLEVPLSTLFQAWHDTRTRARWLGEAITIRTATPNKSMRITWADGKSNVDVNFYKRGAAKSQLAVQHGKLANAKQAERMKSYWAARLDRLKRILES